MKNPLTFWTIVAFVFLVGGAVQTVGVISNTVSSLGIGLLLLVISLSSVSKKTKAWPHLLILFCILLSGIINKTRIPLIGLYTLTFVMIPFSVKLYLNNNIERIPKKLLFQFFSFIGCLQLPVIIIQRIFGEKILAHMARAIDLEDVAYGTFFVANDHGMCFFLIAMIAFLLFEPIQYYNRGVRISLVSVFALSIILANSNIAFLLMAIVFGIYFLRSLTPARIAIVLVPVVGLAILSGVSPSIMSKLETRTDFLYHKIADKDMSKNSAQGAIDQGVAERTDLIIFFVTEKLKVIGDGPFTYFDPIKKEFPRFKNYSQYLWFYSDLGLIGVFLVLLYYFSEFRKQHAKGNYRSILLGVILVFSLFTNTLSDLAFNFTFFLLSSSRGLPHGSMKKPMQCKMDLVCIPYHDWRKIQMEGFRTRDAHFIEHLAQKSSVGTILVLNRPLSVLEYWLKKKAKKIEGKIVLRGPGYTLYQVLDKVFVLDTIFLQVISPAVSKKKWFFTYYGHLRVEKAIGVALKHIGISPDVLLSQNIFAANLFTKLDIPIKIFDAWDNFLLFPEHNDIQHQMKKAYSDYASSATYWTTNSEKNVDFYLQHYQQRKCLLIRNGVDTHKFALTYESPSDLKMIRRPIVGFGGKITHLFDYDLFNYVTGANQDKSFVIVGQILDAGVFNKIIHRKNVHYLGDKSYKTYPSYITNFDMGIIPYVTNNLEHGADSIKTYEYLAANLEVIGTAGAGMSSLSDLIKIGKSKEQFSQLINSGKFVKAKLRNLPNVHLWSSKVDQMISLIKTIQDGEN